MSVQQTTLPAENGGNAAHGRSGESALANSGAKVLPAPSSQIPPIVSTVVNSTFESRQVKQHRAGVGGKKVIARTLHQASSSPSLNSLRSQMAGSNLDAASPSAEDANSGARSTDDTRQGQHSLLLQVSDWLQNEKTKLATQREKARRECMPMEIPDSTKSGSPIDDMQLALDQLERILEQYSSSRENIRPRGAITPKQRSLVKGLRRGSYSDSDYTDTDQAPSAHVTLDNSKTLLYSGGEADSDIHILGADKPSAKDRENWLRFKAEILRLIHTLNIKGWRRVPLDAGGELEVVRLSGALTNAVYVVSPPKNVPNAQRSDSSLPSMPRKPPPKLLLRVYGPQVEHLIDRERELQILRRLGKKNIGPRVLGTFNNGRFEQYFNAKPLTSRELRIPETSKQIAKRMKELHDGIDLLPEERQGGPSLWKNWDKWVSRCEKVITWLDQEILSKHNALKAANEPWRSRGFVCCVPWATFRAAVDRYRKWLEEHFGGESEISKQLVFAHNDTQYGNLLRLQPSEESPLLLPANEHKQLVVIDFEYASANMRGVEFANHFTEWCYNYHDAERPWACRKNWYPNPEEQERFIRAYLKHPSRPAIQSANSSVSHSQSATQVPTPVARATYVTSPRMPPFLLDSFVPSLNLPLAESDSRDPIVEAEVQKLLRETRLWRIANSAQWVAWGIVQAHVPGMKKALSQEVNRLNTSAIEASIPGEATAPVEPRSTDSTPELDPELDQEQVKQEVEAEEVADEFDYLGYAQDRALFFWSDLLAFGFIKEEELPIDLIEHVKRRIINY
ncbi:phosphotransferase [Emydomyces testavorans]|uniref:Phosphotransferase n=1 Tax=Emydomyces testavorans TaxID=2070801 RepID=A0AAF0IFI0_9EURO|nr:phosphotransferase [Emydomyces testavorans]